MHNLNYENVRRVINEEKWCVSKRNLCELMEVVCNLLEYLVHFSLYLARRRAS